MSHSQLQLNGSNQRGIQNKGQDLTKTRNPKDSFL
jgi:hypothetical protein